MYNKNGSEVYGLGLIGALFYYFQNLAAFSLVPVLMAILKSIVWPAMIVYNLLGFLGM